MTVCCLGNCRENRVNQIWSLFSNWSQYSRELNTHTINSGLPWWPSSKESVCNSGTAWDLGLIPGSGTFPGGGHGNPLQYSCLENPTDRGAQRVAVRGVAKSQTQPKWVSMYTPTIPLMGWSSWMPTVSKAQGPKQRKQRAQPTLTSTQKVSTHVSISLEGKVISSRAEGQKRLSTRTWKPQQLVWIGHMAGERWLLNPESWFLNL